MECVYGDKPASLDGYLERMSKVIFTAGINWKVVEAKWEGTRLIRNRKKLEAIIDNANTMLELDKSPGGFAGYLAGSGDFQAKVAALKRDFKFTGPSSAHIFLAMVGEPVPESHDPHHFSHGPAGSRASRRGPRECNAWCSVRPGSRHIDWVSAGSRSSG